VVTLAEIQKGIELLVESKRRTQLEQWLTQDLEVARPYPSRGSSGCHALGIAGCPKVRADVASPAKGKETLSKPWDFMPSV
jgi:hypothetical protein